MISECTCISKYQDRIHGSNRRVFNVPSVQGTGDVKAKCANCEKEKTVHLKRD